MGTLDDRGLDLTRKGNGSKGSGAGKGQVYDYEEDSTPGLRSPGLGRVGSGRSSFDRKETGRSRELEKTPSRILRFILRQ